MRRKSASPSRSNRRRILWRLHRLPIPLALVVGLIVLATNGSLPTNGGVRHVADGDTIELASGQHVRYIGIDTPESRRRVGGRWVDDPQPFSKAATKANRELVEGRSVRLEYDVETHDKYGRLLAYVYVPTPSDPHVMVNEELLRQGLARLLTVPPNVKYVERFQAALAEAKRHRRGMWR